MPGKNGSYKRSVLCGMSEAVADELSMGRLAVSEDRAGLEDDLRREIYANDQAVLSVWFG